MSEKTAVRFIKPAPPYLTGDVAVFDRARAQQLCDRKVAEPHKATAAPETPAPKSSKGKETPADPPADPAAK